MKPTLWIVFVLFSLPVFSQPLMTYFSPEGSSYGIYYPKDFNLSINRTDVSFTDTTEGGISITVSSHVFEDKALTGAFIVRLSEFTGIKREDWTNYKSKFDNLFEGSIQEDIDEYWMWWAIIKEKHAMAISVNKPSKITDEDVRLIRYMIENLDLKFK